MRSQSLTILLLSALIALSTQAASAATYKVRKGDSLDRIARKHQVGVEAIREANGLEGDALKPGMRLSIPSKTKTKATVAAEASAAASDSAPAGATETEWAGYRTVRNGDTFASIAESNGISVGELKRLNPGKNPKRLKAGMRLRIQPPGAVVAAVPKAARPVDPAAAAPKHRPAQPEPEATENESPATHTVRKGDTFARIARANGMSADELRRLNPGANPRRLKIGMKLDVNPASCAVPVASASEGQAVETASAIPAEEAGAGSGPVYHKVRKGDTLGSIASKHGVSVQSIKRLNSGKQSKKLKVGSRLLVRRGDGPGESGTTTVTAARRIELEKILQKEAALTAEGAKLAAAQIAALAPAIQAGGGSDSGSIVEESVGGGGITERVIDIAKLMLDLPYRFGGTSLTGIDCSGYVQKVFGFLNIPLPRTAREQFAKGERIEKEELATGDLVFFQTYARFPSHVGIYLGDNKFIHASSGDKKVKIDSLDAPYFVRRYIGARRLILDPKDEQE